METVGTAGTVCTLEGPGGRRRRGMCVDERLDVREAPCAAGGLEIRGPAQTYTQLSARLCQACVPER